MAVNLDYGLSGYSQIDVGRIKQIKYTPVIKSIQTGSKYRGIYALYSNIIISLIKLFPNYFSVKIVIYIKE